MQKNIKVSILNESKQSVGGGWTFIDNLIKGLNQLGQEAFVSNDDSFNKADICLIPSVTMITKEYFNRVRLSGKKIVCRLDNIPRNSRNRNTGTSRLYDFANRSDEIVYQCEWAKDYLIGFLKKEGSIIYNGIDTDIFKPEGDRYDFKAYPVYIYSRYNRDENKRWEEAWYKYQMIQRVEKKALLIIVGNFSDEQIVCNFDFFNGEKIKYLGIIQDKKEMAKILRSANYMLAPYYNECYSNTLLEAKACGIEFVNISLTGGTPELLSNPIYSCKEMANNYLSLFKGVLK